MKKTAIILTTALAASFASAESIMKPFNETGYGTISGRVQSLTMTCDLDKLHGGNSTLGAIINYTSPEVSGFDAGVGYVYAREIYDNNNTAILGNPDITVFNEAFGRYNFGTMDLSNTVVTVGRKINNAEVFRADDIRQKSRSIMAIQAESTDIKNWRIAGGHAFEKCDWNRDEFVDLGSDGITWAEACFTGIEKLELAFFDAREWDRVNMWGGRGKYDINEKTAILGYVRKENAVGSGTSSGDALGVSIVQKVGQFTLEGGFLGIYGDGLAFDQRSIGFNHALGYSLLMRSGQWQAGASTFYLKATTKLEKTKTKLYTLINYTSNDKVGNTGNGYEVDIIISQPITENFTVAIKGGIGEAESTDTATDARLFLTYAF